MSFISHLIKLNELQVNGQTIDDNDDFNIEDNENPTNAEAQGESPSDTAQNNADNQTQEPEADTTNGEESAPTAQNDIEDQEDDFTLDDTEEPTPVEDTTATQTEETSTEGNTTGDGDQTTAPEDPEGDDDFTVDGGEEPTEDGGTTDQPQNNTPPAKQTPADPTDGITDDDDRAAEEAIYDSLTDDQKRIRVLQLKLNYKDLYETMTNTLGGINNIPKNADNLETIKRLILLITKAKNILIDYVENNFDSNPYLENYTMYVKYIAVLRTASKVIEELNAEKD